MFIGARAIIMPGVTIGKNSIIAAGSIVTKSVSEGSLVAGNPAKVISSVEDYNEKNKLEDQNKKIFDSSFTLKGEISPSDKKMMYEELINDIGFVL